MTKTDMSLDVRQAPPTTAQESEALVDALCLRYRNWGRWGDDDERGTLNFITPEAIVEAATLIRTGRVVSCALPFDGSGPQSGGFGGRTNPVHSMLARRRRHHVGGAGPPRGAALHRRRRVDAAAVRHAVGRAGTHLLPRPDVQRPRPIARHERGRQDEQHRPDLRRGRGSRHPSRHPAPPRRAVAGVRASRSTTSSWRRAPRRRAWRFAPETSC